MTASPLSVAAAASSGEKSALGLPHIDMEEGLHERKIPPLPPLVDDTGLDPHARSLSMRRRRCKARADEGLATLNDIFGGERPDPGPCFDEQQRVLAYTSDCYWGMGCRPLDVVAAGRCTEVGMERDACLTKRRPSLGRRKASADVFDRCALPGWLGTNCAVALSHST